MRYNERTQASLKARGKKLDLIRMIRQDKTVYYVIRIDRKVWHACETEFAAYKAYVALCQNILLQLKIY